MLTKRIVTMIVLLGIFSQLEFFGVTAQASSAGMTIRNSNLPVQSKPKIVAELKKMHGILLTLEPNPLSIAYSFDLSNPYFDYRNFNLSFSYIPDPQFLRTQLLNDISKKTTRELAAQLRIRASLFQAAQKKYEVDYAKAERSCINSKTKVLDTAKLAALDLKLKDVHEKAKAKIASGYDRIVTKMRRDQASLEKKLLGNLNKYIASEQIIMGLLTPEFSQKLLDNRAVFMAKYSEAFSEYTGVTTFNHFEEAVAVSVLAPGYASTVGVTPSPPIEGNFETIGSYMTIMPVSEDETISECSSSAELPNGLSINPLTCVISGTPTTYQEPTSYTITATTSSEPISATVSISVAASVPTISYSGASGRLATIDHAMSVTPTTLLTNGAAITNCTATLPAGLTIHNTTCVISGIPTAVQAQTSYNVTASNSAGSSTTNVYISVAPFRPTISYAGASGTSASVGVSTSIAPTTLLNKGAAITNCTATLPAGLIINKTNCVISGSPTTPQALTSTTITATNSAGSTTANVSISVAASPPTISYAGASGTSASVGASTKITPKTLLANGAEITGCTATLPAGLIINNTTCVISGIPTTPQASTSTTITVTNSAGSRTASVSISVAASRPTISYTGASGTNAIVGASTSITPTTLLTNGAAITCTANDLPAGLTINSTTCVISGIPTVLQAKTSYSITASNSAGSTTASVSISVVISRPTISFAGASGTSGNVGVSMSISPTTLFANGSPITNCTATLPAGLTIHNTTCVISGIPTTQQASTSTTITATNSVGSSSANVSLEVNPPLCPAGYILVPNDPNVGTTSDFCVMKYEARCATTIAATTLCPDPTWQAGPSKIAVSVPNGYPWNSVGWQYAKEACTNLNAINGVSNKYDIISNPEWMTIARNIEGDAADPRNWVWGYGSTLNRGHTDGSPQYACDATLPNVQTNCTTLGTDPTQKRTHTLDNGEVIWDLSGNMFEWVDWTPGGDFTTVAHANKAYRNADGGPVGSVGSHWRQFSQLDRNIDNGMVMNTSTWQSLNTALSWGNGIGGYWGATSGQTGANRGGYFADGDIGGVYLLRFMGGQNGTTGFRCVYRP